MYRLEVMGVVGGTERENLKMVLRFMAKLRMSCGEDFGGLGGGAVGFVCADCC